MIISTEAEEALHKSQQFIGLLLKKNKLVKPEVEGNLLNLINICPNFHVINGTSGDIFPSTSETLPVLNTVLETISHKKAIARYHKPKKRN